MKTSVIVVDGFYADPMDVRTYALNSSFDVRGNYPGLRTQPFLHAGIYATIQAIVQAPIVYWPTDTYNGAFQYTTKDARTWVHSDHTTNRAGVLFLTPDAPPSAGTSFFRHQETGLDVYPDDPELRAQTDRDAGDFGKWSKTDAVANMFNRLVIFDSNRFHSADHYFGDGLEDGRLFQTFFFSTAY